MKKSLVLLSLAILVVGAILVSTLSRQKSTVETASEAIDGVKSLAEPTSTEIISTGEEPRELLRLTFQAGSTQDVEMKMQMTMGMNMGGMPPQKTQMPWIHIPMSITVNDVSADGVAALSALMKQAKISVDENADPQLAAGMESAFGGISDIRCDYKVNARGVPYEVKCTVPEGAPAHTAQMLTQMNDSMLNSYVFLPEEAIGVGGKWKVLVPNFAAGGVKTQMESTYEVTSIEDRVIGLKVAFTQTFEEQIVETPPGMPQTVEIALKKGNGEGNGTMKLDLRSAMPEFELTSKVMQEMMMSDPNQPDLPVQTMTSNVEMKIAVSKAS